MPELSQEMTADQLQFRAGLISGGGFFYPHTLTWSDGVARQFVVIDPSAGKKAGNIVLTPDRAALRTVEFHPDSPAPAIGATVAWEGGTLHLGFPTDVDDLSGQALYACCQADARYFPEMVTSSSGLTFLVRIIARGALPLTVGSGLQDVQGSPNASHVGFVEPGVKLHGGDVITLPSGDAFTVVPPLQHALLGDTVGLSWQGERSVFPVDPDPTPDEPGTPVTSPSDDSWWNG